MLVVAWLVTLLSLATLAHFSGQTSEDGKGKRGVWQQLCDGVCAIILRVVHLAFAIHRSFQAWVQSSLTQAEFDVQELLQGDETDDIVARRNRLADFLTTLPQRPEHFAAIIPEPSAREDDADEAAAIVRGVDSVETLCAWCILAKVPCLTVYSKDGGLKSSLDSIAYRLRTSKMLERAANGRVPQICLEDGEHIEYLGTDAESAAAPGHRFDIRVSLWSREDGYPSLARLSQELCRLAEVGSLNAKDIDEAYIAAKLKHAAGFPHPELVLLYDDLVCLPEFPPWQLQSSEVFQIGSAAGSLDGAVCRALVSYARIEKRWGK
ncbi:hypothetical protein GQ54DRAFT_285100 [Martensiomyces pterosporus]|nr:hypothetical protein GQ54DRAFT_285100 [Martensiomyces pterosporus]